MKKPTLREYKLMCKIDGLDFSSNFFSVQAAFCYLSKVRKVYKVRNVIVAEV